VERGGDVLARAVLTNAAPLGLDLNGGTQSKMDLQFTAFVVAPSVSSTVVMAHGGELHRANSTLKSQKGKNNSWKLARSWLACVWLRMGIVLQIGIRGV
jgi:hypothetical protein